MGTSGHRYKSTYNLLRGLRGLRSTVIIRVISYKYPEPPSRLTGSKELPSWVDSL